MSINPYGMRDKIYVMSHTQHITCYLCERENQVPAATSGTSAIRCGACRTLLIDMMDCPSCGAQNRIKIRIVEHQKVLCGKCRAVLPTSPLEHLLSRESVPKDVLHNVLTIEGKMYQWRGEWETAIKVFQQAQKYTPNTWENQIRYSISIGLCHAYLGNYEKAAEYIGELDEMELLDEFSVLYELARAYALIGDVEQAIYCFEETRELLGDPISIQHIDNLLDSLYEIRDIDTAGPIALQTTILLYDAKQDYDTNNHQAGIQKLQQALDLDPMNPTICHQLGIGLLHQGQFEEAVAMLERGLEFDPMHEQAQFALGDAYFHLRMYECALNAYKQTLNLNPHNIDAYHHLGLIYERQGEIEIAKGYWEDVLKVDPIHKGAVHCLAKYA